MSKRILFLDIDGVVLPGRAYYLPTQTKPIVTQFDPCAVSLLLDACWKQERKIVIHSAWLKYDKYKPEEESTLDHCIKQGILRSFFHPTEPTCVKDLDSRWDRIRDYLTRHKDEIEDYVILDDEVPNERDRDITNGHYINTDFEEGITMETFNRIRDGNWKIKPNG